MTLPKLVGQGPGAISADLSENSSVQNFPLGTRVTDVNGNEYVYVLNGESSTAFARGKVAMQEAAVDVDTVSSNTAKTQITEASAGWTAGAYSNYLVYVNSGTGQGQLRRIISNTTDTLTLEDALTTSLSVTDSDILIFNPYVVNLATASGQTVPFGVAVGAITAGYYGWLQVSGVAEVLSGSSATTANLAVVMGDDTAGQVTVVANGNDLFDVNPLGFCLAANDVADLGIPVKLTHCR